MNPKARDWSKFRDRCLGLLLLVCGFSLLTNFLMLTGPFFMLQVYDRVLSSGSQETLVALFGLVIVLYFFYGVLEFSRSSVMSKVSTRFQEVMGSRVFEAFLQRAALRKGLDSGRSSLNDLDAIGQFFASPIALALFDIPWTPVYLWVIFVFHPMLGWLAVVGGCVLIVTALLNQRLTRRLADTAKSHATQAGTLARQAEASGDYVWAQGMTTTITQRWTELRDKAMNRQTIANDRQVGFSSFSKAFRLFLQSAMLALGAALVLDEQLTPGAMIAASILLGRALAPVEQTIAHWVRAQQALLGYNMLKRFLTEIEPESQASILPNPQTDTDQPLLEVRDLSVESTGTDKRFILNNMTFSLFSGEILGIIGVNGAGKTTLIKTILNVIPPKTGEIRLGGAALQQYGTEQLGRLIGYLPQDVKFFDGSVAENIAHMHAIPDLERIYTVAVQAGVHDLILTFPKGYDTLIGSNYLPLSGGQRQRLALARALFSDPVLFALDEPNSSLDNQGKAILNRVILEMKNRTKTIMIMTHKGSSVLMVCDKVLVLEHGQITIRLQRKQDADGRVTFEPC